VVVELTRGNPREFARLKPPSDLKGRPTVPPDNKTSSAQVFKLPRDIPPAKPFAVLDAKQHVVAMAVAPDGKRVALGSQHTLNRGFTADLAVWDAERKSKSGSTRGWSRRKTSGRFAQGIFR
jgi:hypothetical protein